MEREVRVAGVEARLAIIGSSHFLEIRSGGVTFTEMLAARRPGLAELPVVSRPKHGEDTLVVHRDGLSYRFRMWREQYADSSPLESESERLAHVAPSRMSYIFPSCPGEAAALTCVEWTADACRLTVETYHTFPGESTIVRSWTEVESSEKGATP